MADAPKLPQVLGNAPILLTRDVVKVAEYYRDCCGFSFDRYWGEPPVFVILNRGSGTIMYCRTDQVDRIVPNWKVVEKTNDVYFWVDDAQAIYEEFIRNGAQIDYELYEAPHGCLEFGIQDPDGHDIAFGQVL